MISGKRQRPRWPEASSKSIPEFAEASGNHAAERPGEAEAPSLQAESAIESAPTAAETPGRAIGSALASAPPALGPLARDRLHLGLRRTQALRGFERARRALAIAGLEAQS